MNQNYSYTEKSVLSLLPRFLALSTVVMKRIILVIVAALLVSGGMHVTAAEARDAFANSLPADSTALHNRAKLIDLWSNASRKPLGKEDDEIQVRIITLPNGLSVSTVRWLQADSAVAQCNQEEVRYLAFFFRENGKWTYVRHYSLGKAKK